MTISWRFMFSGLESRAVSLPRATPLSRATLIPRAIAIKITALLCLLLPALLQAQSQLATTGEQEQSEYQSLPAIYELVKTALQQRAEAQGLHEANIEVSSLDSRLRLAKCDDSLSATPNANSALLGRSSVQVSCSSPKAWRIYVQALTSGHVQVPVLVDSLDRDTIIRADDVELRYLLVTQELMGVVDNIHLVIGKSTNRFMSAGEPIRASHLSSPILVRRGQHIQLKYVLGSLEITMAGIAQRDASSGQWIKVQNSESGALVDGLVNPDGSITVPGG